MNNANHAFRSHLMQQFVTQARNQSRPPLALMGLITEESDCCTTTESSNPSRRHYSTPAATTTTAAAAVAALPRRSLVQQHHHHRGLRLQQPLPTPIAPRFLSAAPNSIQEEGVNDEASNIIGFQPNLSLLFQDMLQTRRSSSRFLPYSISSSSSSSSLLLSSISLSSSGAAVAAEDEEENNDSAKLLHEEQLYWKQVLERAVQCGCQAPNHKRTEPFTFKRMIAPSLATERLADIFYHVTLRKQQQQRQSLLANKNNNNKQQSAAAFAINTVEEMERTAQLKRDKWSQIPAFLVTIVSSPSTVIEENGFDSDNDDDNKVAPEDQAADVDGDEEMMDEYLYEPLPYSPPPNERALEDYASACAATQNVLLSLHSEDVASKWVTGPVIRTRAFRNLVLGEHSTTQSALRGGGGGGAHLNKNDERIVALIPVGHYVPTSSSSHQQGEKTISIQQQQQESSDESPSPSSSSSIMQQHHLYHHGRRRRYKRPLHGNLLVDL